MSDTAYDYVESGTVSGSTPKVVTGAGNNPSTWAGIIVLAALFGLGVFRKSFRRFM